MPSDRNLNDDFDGEEKKNPLQQLSMSSFGSSGNAANQGLVDQDMNRKINSLQKQMIVIEEEARSLRDRNSMLDKTCQRLT